MGISGRDPEGGSNPKGVPSCLNNVSQFLGREKAVAVKHVVAVWADGPEVTFRINLPFTMRERIKVMDVDEAFAMLTIAFPEVEAADHA